MRHQSLFIKTMIGGLLFISYICSTCWALNYDASKPVDDLKSNIHQAISSISIVRFLEKNHYNKLQLDKINTYKIFDHYLDKLDPQRSFFLEKDIKEFFPYRKTLFSNLKRGDLKPAFIIFNRYRMRAEQRARYMSSLIKKGVDHLDFTKEEQLLINRKAQPWLKTKIKQKALWAKQFKENVLVLKLNNKTDKEILAQLKKRNNITLRRLYQGHSEDAFQNYINVFTGIYDPHTQYFSPVNAENFDINMSLSLEGIGAVLQEDEEYIKVISIVAGGPAGQAGQLQPGDKILSVGQGKSGKFDDIVGMRLDDAVKLIRGTKNTLVRLEVIPAASKEGSIRIYSIIRDRVKLEEQDASSKIITIKNHGKKQKIGVITLPIFYADFKAAQKGDTDYKSTTRDVKKLITELKQQKVEGIIIDLRNNGGGSLQEANDLTGLFIGKGVTVLVRDNSGRVEKLKSKKNKIDYNGAMLILVNRFSASAAEIFAGAMQDYSRALIVGSDTYGKGTVQSIQPLNHGQLKLTLAKFYRVSGQSTQNKGVLPDIVLPDLYYGKDIGEKFLPAALNWDTIPAIAHKTFFNLRAVLPSLKQENKQRITKNPYFIYLKEIKKYMQKYDEQQVVSLNFNKRQSYLQQMRSNRLAIENRLRKARGDKLFNNLDELEIFQIDNKKESVDEILLESGNILGDYILLNTI